MVLFTGITTSGCARSDEEEASPDVLRDVPVETVRLETVPDEIEVPGTLQAAATAQVSAQIMGAVTQVSVREGDFVKRDQVLARLDGRELEARRMAAASARDAALAAVEETERAVAAAQSQEEIARKTLDRFSYLQARESVSPQEFDEVAARHRAAYEALAKARASRDRAGAMRSQAESELVAAGAAAAHARVVAPFDGVVARRLVDPGSVVMPGTPLLVVQDVSRFRMEVTMDARSASRIGRGSAARVRLDALPGRELLGSVTEIETAGDAGSQTLRAKIDLAADPALRSGWFGRAWFRSGETQALMVPRKAVVERGQLRGVYALDPGQIARLRLVSLGRERDERVEVLAGLSAGDRVLSSPGPGTIEGLKVEAR